MHNFIRIFRGAENTEGKPINSSRACRLIASATFVGLIATATCLAEQPSEQPATEQTQPTASSSHPALDLRAYISAPFNLASAEDSSSSSSSSIADAASSDEAAITERLSHLSLASDSNQPPPRRPYSQPRYADSRHNADGSNKWGFQVGAGFNLPVGVSHGVFTTGFDFQAGGGRFFSKKFGVQADFDWHSFGIDGGVLTNLLTLYNSTCPGGCGLTSLGGSSHVWSFTVNPIYTFYQGEKLGSYVRGGVGFYHKTSNFTIPSIGVYCDPFYGCFQYAANQTIDKYTSNAFGVEGGVGFTYRPSRFAGESFYAEARYIFVDNKARPFSLGNSNSNYFNVFPQNSDKTTLIPITFGLRF